MIDLSLNEVETLAAKAARGTGLPWGAAEDTGRAAAWIARRTEDWATSLLALLESPGEESPLLLAGWLADAVRSCHFAQVAWPLWALPGLLATTRRPVSVLLGDAEAMCNPGEPPSASVPTEILASLSAAPLTVSFGTAPPLPHMLAPKYSRSRVAPSAWQRLQALAHRTYVPASDHSRRTGAGAGRLDDE